MKKLIYIGFLLIFISAFAQAQTTYPTRTSKGESYSKKSEYSMPSKKSSKKAKKAYKNSYTGQFDRKIEEYEDRMQANAKKYKKMSKDMKKPQYSDPSYFGHKNKPKKRKPGKKKFCKECQIVH
jgi:hypothetical protein